MLRISAWTAVVFGLALGVLEVVRNWGDWEWWPFWVVDYVAAALLVAGGMFTIRRRTSHVLTAGWGFTCAMFWMSFFGHYKGVLEAGSAAGGRELRLTWIIGVMFAITLFGLSASLTARSGDRRA
ncbi:hypothetical protein [Phenylobacterium sp.]|uniref:hypothetical protein n=1 Tax=Phenylobacterium sp. TaxID=1871053 RepID=UPI0035B1D8A8